MACTEVRAAGLVLYRWASSKIEYLLLQTSYGHHHWSPPKGHVDPGENDFEAAVRESQEESGLTPQDFKVNEEFRKELHYIAHEKPKIVVYWLAELTNPSATVKLSHEHQDYRWTLLPEAKSLVEYQDMQNLLQECEHFLMDA